MSNNKPATVEEVNQILSRSGFFLTNRKSEATDFHTERAVLRLTEDLKKEGVNAIPFLWCFGEELGQRVKVEVGEGDSLETYWLRKNSS